MESRFSHTLIGLTGVDIASPQSPASVPTSPPSCPALPSLLSFLSSTPSCPFVSATLSSLLSRRTLSSFIVSHHLYFPLIPTIAAHTVVFPFLSPTSLPPSYSCFSSHLSFLLTPLQPSTRYCRHCAPRASPGLSKKQEMRDRQENLRKRRWKA